MAPEGSFGFQVPRFRVAAKSVYADNRVTRGIMQLSGLLFEPDVRKVTLYWSRSVPLGHGAGMHLRVPFVCLSVGKRCEYSSVGISGVGMCTPLGLSTSASEAAFRAGFLCATETPMKGKAVNQSEHHIFLFRFPPTFRRNERMLDLAARALEDLVSSGEPALQERISAFVGLPAKMDAALSGQLMNSLTNLLHIRVQRQVKVSFFCQGRSAFFFALEGALEALYYGTCDVALVGCTESLCSPEILRH